MRSFSIPIVVVFLGNLSLKIEHIEALNDVLRQGVFMGCFGSNSHGQILEPIKIIGLVQFSNCFMH
jgi:hypothetical protein